MSLAKRNLSIEEFRQKVAGTPHKSLQSWLYIYHFPSDALNELNVKEFKTANRDWMKFVTLNRQNRKRIHNYDMVIGPTANDKTNAVIQIYLSGGYGTIGSDKAIDTLLGLIEPDKLPAQYFFATERAVKYLKLIKKEQL